MHDDPVLVLVIWRDSYGVGSHWSEIKELKPAPLHCSSVGWLVHDGEECVVIVPHMSEPNHDHIVWQGCGDMTIPRAAIISIHELDKGREVGDA